jgi:membrane protease YdiL (CAAX protease family)
MTDLLVVATPVRAWTARHPVAAFLIIVFALAYPLMALPILATHGVIPGGGLIERLPIAADELAGLLLTVGALVPATVYVTWAVDGRAGLRRLLSRLLRWRVNAVWWLVVLVALPALTVGIALVLGDSPRDVDPVDALARQAGLLAVNLALVNLWEEAAWSGVLQTRLEHRHSLVVAALLVAVPFALIHWPLAFFGEITAAGAAVALIGYLVLCAIFRPMLAVVLRGTGGSVLLVAVLHSVFNRSNNENGIAAGLLDGENRQLAVLVAALLVTAAGAVAARRTVRKEPRA